MCLLDLISIRTHQVIRELAVFLKPTHTCFPESPEHWWINWDRVEPETLYCQIQRNYHCCCSVVSDSVTPWIAALQASLSSTISWSLLRLMSIESVINEPSNHLILSPPSPPALSLSQHQGLFHWIDSPQQVAKLWEVQLCLSVMKTFQNWLWLCSHLSGTMSQSILFNGWIIYQ